MFVYILTYFSYLSPGILIRLRVHIHAFIHKHHHRSVVSLYELVL